jgi:tetratricopeptide (TPR) repeat protein
MAVKIEDKTCSVSRSLSFGAFRVSEYYSHRRQQLLREAEGYLELACACGDQLVLDVSVRNGLAERALATLNRLGSAGVYHVEATYLRGQALRTMNRHHEAIEYLREAADLDTENVHVWLALGWCYKRVGRLDLAIESLEQAMDANCSRAIIYYNLACYWSLAENAKLALAYLTRAFDLDPSYRDLVSEEEDFNPIRKDPRFMELTSVIV